MSEYNKNYNCPICKKTTTNYKNLRFGSISVGLCGDKCNECKSEDYKKWRAELTK